MQMRKGNKIFIFIFIIEIILFLIGILFTKGTCNYSTLCSIPTFFNPLGIQFSMCIQVLAQSPCNLGSIYLTTWIIIFTIVAYVIYWIKSRK